MKAPALQVVKRLFALSRNRCAYPGCPAAIIDPSGTLIGDVAHIRASQPGGPRYDSTQSDKARHGFDNLLLLCALHHRIVDDQPARFTVEVLQDMKRDHEAHGRTGPAPNVDQAARRLRESCSTSTVHAHGQAQVMIGSPGSIQARDITIRTNRKSPVVPLPGDTVGADSAMRSYLEYLNDRYIECRNNGIRRGIDRRPFFPGMLHNLIKSHFGARTNLVPQGRFPEVVAFMQRAIDNTIWGRNSPHRNYHSFEEHRARVHGGPVTRSPGKAEMSA